MKNSINVRDYQVIPGTSVRLEEWPTLSAPLYCSDSDYKERLSADTQHLSELQDLLYADNQYSLLLIFQAMDAAGKHSAIRHVMCGVDPLGCQVFNFRHPRSQALDEDAHWLSHLPLPERGRIGIFNRSYYEEMLIARGHPDKHQLPQETVPEEKVAWEGRFNRVTRVRPVSALARDLRESALEEKTGEEGRYGAIVHTEYHLHRNGIRVIKFFLHQSREEQRRRFIERIVDPEKNWTFSSADMERREAWEYYMEAYETVLAATSTRAAPWYVIPADDKKNARLIISQVILGALADLNLRYPQVSAQQRKILRSFRRKLEAESEG